jgi:hypothetical protein
VGADLVDLVGASHPLDNGIEVSSPHRRVETRCYLLPQFLVALVLRQSLSTVA